MAKVAEIKQENIIRSAINIFAEKGLEQASMEAIAKQAEVSKRTLYKYYPTKDSLFSVIVDRLLDGCKVMKTLTFDADVEIRSQLVAIAQKEVTLLCQMEFLTLSRMVMTECIRSNVIANIMLERLQNLEGGYSFEQWIENANATGKLAVPHPQIAAEQFFASLKAVVFWPQILMHQPIASEQQQQLAITCAVNQFLAAYAVKQPISH
ncbi:TetR/AcrR family transcriptional regulator [Photobacterium sanguinicancri]|uniref:TetR family transcriptional regulator n=1 Tax=Photobacterium sanguinicancri TaxID=875932 RepID=A0ABX4FRX1_9GAMM|nr:TetR/AcrR family transcriptional regulator [Photobacterium sanguinicancri]OZS41573.1 TetR family transcriptional regulator [Photobacterium sanguinicancri]